MLMQFTKKKNRTSVDPDVPNSPEIGEVLLDFRLVDVLRKPAHPHPRRPIALDVVRMG